MSRRVALVSSMVLLWAAGCAPEPATQVLSAIAPATPPGVTVGAVYVEIISAADDVLVELVTPVAEKIEIHETVHRGDMMQMRPVTEVPLKAGKPLRFAPGGMHLMLMNLRKPLLVDQSFPLDLHLRKAGIVTANVIIVSPGTIGASH